MYSYMCAYALKSAGLWRAGLVLALSVSFADEALPVIREVGAMQQT